VTLKAGVGKNRPNIPMKGNTVLCNDDIHQPQTRRRNDCQTLHQTFPRGDLQCSITDYDNRHLDHIVLCEGFFDMTATDIGGKSDGFSGTFMNTGGNIGGLVSPNLSEWSGLRSDFH
jgi:hypothetical protein